MSEEKDSDLSSEVREEYERMEAWMDDHPEFVHDYFARKAKRSMVDGWLIAHAIGLTHSQVHSDTNSSGSNSKQGSGANTPVRKISAQEFEKGGILKPMVSNVDGNLTFLGQNASLTSQVKTNRKSRSELKALDERELMYELVIDICNELDVTSLCHKILLNVCILVNADRCSLFLVQGKGTEEKYLASELFDIHSESVYEETVENTQEIRIPWGTGIIGYVAKTGEGVNIPDAYEDPRFSDEIDTKTGYKTRSIISNPIKDCEGEVIGVAQAVNKISPQDEPFDEHDEKVFASYLAFCGIGLKNAQLYERSLLENKRNEVLLDLARVIFEEQIDVANLIHKIMMHTQSLLQCERCQVLLVDDHHKSIQMFYDKDMGTFHKDKNKRLKVTHKMGIFSQVFDLQASDFDNDDSYHREGNTEPRFPINIGITGFVAATGGPLNIPDAYKDDRFDAAVDENQANFRTRSILCMPIKNACGQVIGVSQLINKLDETPFNKNDENLFEAFAIFCGMGINNTQMYEKAVKAMAKQSVALDVLSYHATAPAEQAQRIKNMGIPSSKFFNLLDFGFNDFSLDDDDTLRACIRMFLDLDLVERFHINYEVLCRWLLSVKKNYRDVTYHNWRHAFNVAQTMFYMMKCGEVSNLMSDHEKLALMVGCLCHDLDHRGTTNQFMIKTASPLAQLYTTSTLEHHHFDQCIMILSTKGNDILGQVHQEDYERVIQLIESAILATDLALYFRYRGEFFDMVHGGRANWNCDDHRDLLRSMLMTACDVAAITKPWRVQQKVAQLIASEFFEQGDIEKTELNIKPQDMMDRDKQDQFPAMQVGFIDTICMPVYSAIAQVNPKLETLLNGCKENRVHWQEQAEIQNRKMADETLSENKDKDKVQGQTRQSRSRSSQQNNDSKPNS